VQKVTKGQVSVGEEVLGKIGPGVVVLLGVKRDDTEKDAQYLARKIAGLRIFPDRDGKMNLSLLDMGDEALVISQFTLYGDCRKGKRPSYTEAAPPELAEELYERFTDYLRSEGIPTQTGKFQAMMLVEIYNDGPVTLIVDSKRTSSL